MKFPEKYRALEIGSAPHRAGDDFGAFLIPASPAAGRPYQLLCVGSAGCEGIPWEHVSVSTPVRCPTWGEMCFVKGLFWAPEECVVQFHPPESEYVNQHPFCLHLWRPTHVELPRPPSLAVGVR